MTYTLLIISTSSAYKNVDMNFKLWKMLMFFYDSKNPDLLTESLPAFTRTSNCPLLCLVPSSHPLSQGMIFWPRETQIPSFLPFPVQTTLRRAKLNVVSTSTLIGTSEHLLIHALHLISQSGVSKLMQCWWRGQRRMVRLVEAHTNATGTQTATLYKLEGAGKHFRMHDSSNLVMFSSCQQQWTE